MAYLTCSLDDDAKLISIIKTEARAYHTYAPRDGYGMNIDVRVIDRLVELAERSLADREIAARLVERIHIAQEETP